MERYSECSGLVSAFNGLSSGNDKIVDRSAERILWHVETANRELSIDCFLQFEDELLKMIFNLARNSSVGNRIGSMKAIDKLISAPTANADNKMIKLSNVLSKSLGSSDDMILLRQNAEVIGHLARYSPVPNNEFVEFELNRALEWLLAEAPHKRYAACLVLQQLAFSVPTNFFARIRNFFEKIWIVVWDSRDFVRESAVAAMSAVFVVLQSRSSKSNLAVYVSVLDRVWAGLDTRPFDADKTHGSLLVVREMLLLTGNFMLPRFKDVSKAVINFLPSKPIIVKLAVVQLIPRLAAFNCDSFARTYLDESMEFLVRCFRSNEAKCDAMEAIGKLVKAVGHYSNNHSAVIVEVLREGLSASLAKKFKTLVSITIVAVADIVCGLMDDARPIVLTLFDALLETGVSEVLVSTLSVICDQLPDLRMFVETRLFSEISCILTDSDICMSSQLSSIGVISEISASESAKLAVMSGGTGFHRRNKTSSSTVPMVPTIGSFSPYQPALLNTDIPSVNSASVSISVAFLSTSKFVNINGCQVPLSRTATDPVAGVDVSLSSGINQSYSISSIAEMCVLARIHKFNQLKLKKTLDDISMLDRIDPTPQDGDVKLQLDRLLIRSIARSVGPKDVAKKRQISSSSSSRKAGDNTIPTSHSRQGSQLNIMNIGSVVEPDHSSSSSSGISSPNRHKGQFRSISAERRRELVCLSLQVFSSFQFDGVLLLPFLKDCVSPYLSDSDQAIRLQASIACCALLRSDKIPFYMKGPSAEAIEACTAMLLGSMISDTSSVIRLKMLNSLHESLLSTFLCRPHHIHTLMLALSDESIDVRETIIKLLGNLANCNFAAVIPPIRQLVVHTMNQLERGYDQAIQEQALHLLSSIINQESFQSILRPLASALLQRLPFGGSDKLAIAAMETLGDLACMMRGGIVPFMSPIISVIQDCLTDRGQLHQQETALRTLRRIITSCGSVVSFHTSFPPLFVQVLDLFPKTTLSLPKSFRTEILRCVGLIGALDPYKYKIALKICQTELLQTNNNLSNNKSDGKAVLEEKSSQPHADVTKKISGTVDDLDVMEDQPFLCLHPALADVTYDGPHVGLVMYDLLTARAYPLPESDDSSSVPIPASDTFFPRVALGSLLRILHDQTLSSHHSAVSHAITTVFTSLGDKCAIFLPDVVPSILTAANNGGSGLRESLFQQLVLIITAAKDLVRPYVKDISAISFRFWSDHTDKILLVMEALSDVVPDEFNSLSDNLVNLLLQSLREIVLPLPPPQMNPSSIVAEAGQSLTISLAPETAEGVKKMLETISRLYHRLTEHTRIIIPSLVMLIDGLSSQLNKWPVILQTSLSALEVISANSEHPVFLIDPQLSSPVIQCTCRTLKAIGQSQTTSYSPLSSSSSSSSSVENPQHLGQISKDLITSCINILCNIAEQIGFSFLNFRLLIQSSMSTIPSQLQPALAADRLQGILVSIMSQALIGPQYRIFGTSMQAVGVLAQRGQLFLSAHGRQPQSSTLTPSRGKKGAIDLSSSLEPMRQSASLTSASAVAGQHLQMNVQHLQRTWDTSQVSASDDWTAWLRSLCVELLRESPSPALRSCSSLAQVYPPLGRELFKAALLSCWYDLPDLNRDNFLRSLEAAFRSSTATPEILQVLLNLVEFMEHDVEPLPIDIRILGQLAQKCKAYAKALHFKELEFHANPAECIDALININMKLDQHDSAAGILTYAESSGLPVAQYSREMWLTKLGHWDEALSQYQTQSQNDKMHKLPSAASSESQFGSLVGKMKCLDALGKWEDVLQLSKDNWKTALVGTVRETPSQALKANQRKAAVLAARAAWQLNDWDKMKEYTSFVERIDESMLLETSIMRAIIAVHDDDNIKAVEAIDGARRLLEISLGSLLGESYDRAYALLISTQQLSELEEIMEYKNKLSSIQSRPPNVMCDERPVEVIKRSVRNDMKISWRKRLQTCRADITVWEKILSVRRLVCPKSEDPDTWIEFAQICRYGGNSSLSGRMLTQLNPSENTPIGLGDSWISQTINLPVVSLQHQSSSMSTVSEARDENFSPTAHASRRSPMTADAVTFVELPAVDSWEVLDRKRKFALARHNWSIGQRDDACMDIQRIINEIPPSEDQLKLNCILKLGQWKQEMNEVSFRKSAKDVDEVKLLYKQATDLNEGNFRAWHEWGMINFRSVEILASETSVVESTKMSSVKSLGGSSRRSSAGIWSSFFHQDAGQQPNVMLVPPAMRESLVQASRGLLKAISIGTRRYSSLVLQDLLCVMSIWFRFGKVPEVLEEISKGLRLSDIDTWLGVIPQLIARINWPVESIRSLLHELLINMGKKHTHALVFPLALQLHSPDEQRRDAASRLMSKMREFRETLVDDTLLVSAELIRVGILWQEKWHGLLEECSRLCFGEGNIRDMINIIVPLHNEVEASPKNAREISFQQTYGRDLSEAHELLKQYRDAVAKSGRELQVRGSPPSTKTKPVNPEDSILLQAWEIYLKVFKKLNKQVQQLQSMELHTASTALSEVSNLALAIPGTYRVDGRCVRIMRFHSNVALINSKQRPRKITVDGEDGRRYMFLLKGHEDLRQDERVMQLFGLANTLLEKDRRTNRSGLSIQRYAVTPLSPNTGIVGWVPNCDTMHALIRDFRDKRHIVLDIERRLMCNMYQEYDKLPLMHKLEIFEESLSNTSGFDLYKVLWLKSENSEVWLDRRTQFTTSMAVMSMVGYILGLGDRHPSNLMLDRATGKVLHIDFGDCFEVAMQREKFPEKVPFRLTRMLVHAMEVCGIEGNFRATCEKVMTVLRRNRDSVVTMLEAFVYDPLVSWRLIDVTKDPSSQKHEARPLVAGETRVKRVVSKPPLFESKASDLASEMSVRKEVVESKTVEVVPLQLKQESDAEEKNDNDDTLSTIQTMAEGVNQTRIVSASHLEHRSTRERSLVHAAGVEGVSAPRDVVNNKAVQVIQRVHDKLVGTDFSVDKAASLDVKSQVDHLIQQATSNENLCQSFVGWCPFW